MATTQESLRALTTEDVNREVMPLAHQAADHIDALDAVIAALRTQLAEANEKADSLEDERVAVHTWGEEQKRRRVYYQDIVYAVCNILDSCWPATHIVCGTIDEASDEVQQAIVKLKNQLAESERMRGILADALEQCNRTALEAAADFPGASKVHTVAIAALSATDAASALETTDEAS